MEGGEERVTTFPFETRFDEEITEDQKTGMNLINSLVMLRSNRMVVLY